MGKLRFEITMSLDGYVAGPEQTEEDPLGRGGEELHNWALGLEVWRKSHGHEGGEANASTPVLEEQISNVGALIMGRNMFGGGPGPWDEENPWNGWWGDDPPYHAPVYVLTHHERDPLTLSDTTFHFVTDGIEPALERARESAGDQDVKIAGGANAAQQYLEAGLVDELELHVVPQLLGDGERLFHGVGTPGFELVQDRVIEAPGVTHLRYRVER